MGKLLKLIVILALLAGAYVMFFQEKWVSMSLDGLNVSAMAPSAGERVETESLDRLLGRFEAIQVNHLSDRISYTVVRMTSRNISQGQITLTQYEEKYIETMSSEYKLVHQSSEVIQYKGHAGVEIRFLLPDGKTENYVRLLPRSGVLYQLEFIGYGGLKNDLKRRRFFNSVKFTG